MHQVQHWHFIKLFDEGSTIPLREIKRHLIFGYEKQGCTKLNPELGSASIWKCCIKLGPSDSRQKVFMRCVGRGESLVLVFSYYLSVNLQYMAKCRRLAQWSRGMILELRTVTLYDSNSLRAYFLLWYQTCKRNVVSYHRNSHEHLLFNKYAYLSNGMRRLIYKLFCYLRRRSDGSKLLSVLVINVQAQDEGIISWQSLSYWQGYSILSQRSDIR